MVAVQQQQLLLLLMFVLCCCDDGLSSVVIAFELCFVVRANVFRCVPKRRRYNLYMMCCLKSRLKQFSHINFMFFQQFRSVLQSGRYAKYRIKLKLPA